MSDLDLRLAAEAEARRVYGPAQRFLKSRLPVLVDQARDALKMGRPDLAEMMLDRIKQDLDQL